MFKIGATIGAIVLALLLMSLTYVPQGNVGVVVNKLGSEKGVSEHTLGVGVTFVAPWKAVYEYPTYTQNIEYTAADEHEIKFQTKKGMSVNADVGASYYVIGDKAFLTFQKYRRGIDEITEIFLRNMIRNSLVTYSSNMEIEDVYGPKKTELLNKVYTEVSTEIEQYGIKVEKLYWISEIRVPEGMLEAINKTSQAIQTTLQRQQEIEQAKAEANKIIEDARGAAESIRLKKEAEARGNEALAKSITAQLVQWEAIKKWDGGLPRINSGVIPFISVDEQGNVKAQQ